MAPITNDLLLAAALTGAATGAVAQTTTATPPSNTPRTGVATTVTTRPAGAATSSTMYIDGTTNQRLTTDANSTLHVLFSDQSALTIGPNSELVIAKYEFDKKAKNGQILIDLTKGLLRVVGGLISKKNETVVRTTTATIGIRGGITVAETDGQQTSATFLFGQRMRATDNNGNTQTINRPGFGFTSDPVDGPVGGLSQPSRIPSSQLTRLNPAPEPTSDPAPAPSPAPSTSLTNQINTQVNTFSSTRQSDPTGTNLVTNPGGTQGGGGRGTPDLKTLLGISNPTNQS